MVERPIFVPDEHAPGLVRELFFTIVWESGGSAVEKKKNINALHAAAVGAGFTKLLEISTKSDEELGRRLSAFNLMFHSEEMGDIPLECAYQGSKVFERGGPYTDLYSVDARTAKRDQRLRDSGRLIGFQLGDFKFPLEPKTTFYDWLYINAILAHSYMLERLRKYDGFTDIQFNPEKSINCQARSCALFIALTRLGPLDANLRSPEAFIALTKKYWNYGITA